MLKEKAKTLFRNSRGKFAKLVKNRKCLLNCQGTYNAKYLGIENGFKKFEIFVE